MIIDADALRAQLADLELEHWFDSLWPVLNEKLDDATHGDLPRWKAAIDALPGKSDVKPELDHDVVTLGNPNADTAGSLSQLIPWRKGPFRICGVYIDTEWRSDLKWNRLAGRIESLQGRRVLDVGGGNGYYALRMLGAGARSVLVADPTLVYVMQFAACSRLHPDLPVQVLPLRLEELPTGEQSFDTVFSMGVLYHQRSPIDHLRTLKTHLRKSGQLVLETLVLPGDSAYARTPEDRYARMRNVWLLPSIPELHTWLSRSGFRDIDVVDTCQTTTEEQRKTEWMPFESLAKALDPEDPDKTIEGWPAPTRAIITARIT